MILKFQPSNVQGKLPRRDAFPILFERVGLETPPVIHLSNDTKTIGSCLRCPVPPCTFYSADEMVNDYFTEFPADTSTKVCPTDAVQIDTERGIPAILSEKCISCGLCVARCPVQAIVLTRGGAHVNDSENDFFRLTGKPVDASVVEAVLRQYRSTPIRGHVVDAEFAAHVYERIVLIGMQSHPQFPNLLARNLMICNGISFLIRRLGDTNMRIDSVFDSGDNRLGVAEIEYSDGVILDSPRDLLDDCAVLHARYGVPLQTIDPLVVSLRFPNKRSEYWQVIQDISQVLKIRIRSITIGALLIIMWENRKLSQNIWQQLYADASAPTIEPALRELLACEPSNIAAYPGWSRAAK